MKALLCLLFGHRLEATHVHQTYSNSTLLHCNCTCCGETINAVRTGPAQLWWDFDPIQLFGKRMQRRLDEAYDNRTV